MNPAEIFFSGLSQDEKYFIPFILDYVKLRKGKTGHHFRIPFVDKTGYVSEIIVPVELIKVYLPFQEVFYNRRDKKVNKIPIGNEEEISFFLTSSSNKPEKVSQFPELSNFLKKHIKEYYHQELERQWITKVISNSRTYYFPSSVIGAFFCFPSSKFATNLFLTDLSREIEDSGKNPPFIQLKRSYSDTDATLLYLYASNQEAKENYDRVGRRHLKKQTYREKENKDVIRYAFKFPFPTSGEWELKVRTIPVSDNSFLVAEIIYVNTRKLLGIDYLEVRRQGHKKVKKEKVLLYSSSSTKSEAVGVYDSSYGMDKKEYPEVVNCQFLSPPVEKSVKIVKRIIYNDYVSSSAIPIPQKKEEAKELSNVRSFSKEGKSKPLKSKSSEISPRDVKSRVFDLEIVKKLMEQVALSLGITMEYEEFVPKIPIKISGREHSKLYYPKGDRRKVGVFYSDLPSGKKMTAIFVDQKFQIQGNYVTSPILIGNRKLEFPGEVAYFFKEFMELNRKNFKNFCERRGFNVHLKKPLQGSSKKDWENWVEVMVKVLNKF